jgi:MFS family permease
LSSRRKAVLTYVVVVFLFALITAAYTSPLLSNANDHVMESATGDAMFNMYVISWTSHSLGSDPLDLFNATIFYPNSDTLAYSDHGLMMSLTALPVLAATDNPTLAFNFVVMMSFMICSLGAFLLVDYLARDRLAAFAAGIIYGFALFKLSHLSHAQVLSAGFIPLALLCLHAYTERKRWGYALGFVIFTVAMFLTSWGAGFFLAFAVLIYLLVLLVVERRTVISALRKRMEPGRRRKLYRWVGILVLSFIAVGLILLPLVIPYLRVQRENPGFQREIEEVYSYSADVTDFLVAPENSVAWGPLTGVFRPDPYLRGNASERSLFTGILPVLLAIAGVFYLQRRYLKRYLFVKWFYLVLLVASGVMCLGVTLYVLGRHLGIPMPYRLLYYLFPGFKAIRTPARMIVLVTLSLSVLGGFGVKWLRSKLADRMDSIAVPVVVAMVLFLLLGELMPSGMLMSRVPATSEIPEVYHWMESRPGEAPMIVLPTAWDPSLPLPDRQLRYTALAPLRMYYNTVNWKKMVNGYSGYIPESYLQAAEATMVFPSDEAITYLDSIGVEYILVEGDRYEPLAVDSILRWAEQDTRVDLVEESAGNYILHLN